MDNGLLILVASVLLVVGGIVAVQMVRKNARESRLGELLGGDNEMAKNESTAGEARDGGKRAVLEAEVAAELFGEMFAMRSAMSELVTEVRSMHQTLSEISLERERERDRRVA